MNEQHKMSPVADDAGDVDDQAVRAAERIYHDWDAALGARDVEAAIDATVGEAATGLVVIIAPDFDGDFAELARGLARDGARFLLLVQPAGSVALIH